MSSEVPKNFVMQWRDTVDLLVRQDGSRLRPTVSIQSGVVGKSTFVEHVGVGTARKRTTRHADTPLTETPHDRTKYDLEDWEYADLLDKQDRVRLLIDPTDPYTQAAKDALGQAMDNVIIAAATGNRRSGEDGATLVALPATQQIAVDFNDEGAPATIGLTVGKLRRARFMMDRNNVSPNEEQFIAVTAQQKQDLLKTTQVTSADFNTVRALVEGKIDTFLGFKFVMTELLALNAGTDVRTCFAYSRRGLELGIGIDIVTRIGERPDKSYSTQVYAMMTLGASRVQEAKVIQILCDQSP